MFFRKFTSNKYEKNKSKMNKPICLGLSILEINKTLMCEFCYHYIKLKYQYSAKLCYIDIDSFIMCILRLKMFTKTLRMMLNKDLIHQAMNLPNHCQ